MDDDLYDGTDYNNVSYDGYDGTDYNYDPYASGDWNYEYQSPEQVTEISNTALPGEPGYGWKYYSDGTAVAPSGSYYYQGQQVWSPSGGGILDKLGGGVASALKAAFTKPDGSVDWRSVAGAAGGLYGLYQASQQNQQPKGYQGSIPKYEAQRTRLELPDVERRPGEYGRRYFSDVVFAPSTPAASTPAEATPAEATPAEPAPVEQTQTTGLEENPGGFAAGGLAGLAKGKYLRGHTDGMADKIPAKISGKQPAALSHGEFVVPADVVSHLGNGNSDAGAKRLYDMMARIRKARTGTTKQGKQVNPDKFMPA